MAAAVDKSLTIITKQMASVWLKIFSGQIFPITLFNIPTMTFFGIEIFIYLIFNVIALGIWTAKEIVVIDCQSKQIGEGFRIFGLSRLDKMRFTSLEKIFVNRVKMVQTSRMVTLTTDVHFETYKAFLKTVEGDKVFVGEDEDKDALILKLKGYNKILKTVIFDTTGVEAIQVE